MTKENATTIIKIENNHGTVIIYAGEGKVEITKDSRANEDPEIPGFTLPEYAEELGLVEDNPPGPGPDEDHA